VFGATVVVGPAAADTGVGAVTGGGSPAWRCFSQQGQAYVKLIFDSSLSFFMVERRFSPRFSGVRSRHGKT
jgi:hypothetical protein